MVGHSFDWASYSLPSVGQSELTEKKHIVFWGRIGMQRGYTQKKSCLALKFGPTNSIGLKMGTLFTTVSLHGRDLSLSPPRRTTAVTFRTSFLVSESIPAGPMAVFFGDISVAHLLGTKLWV